MSAAKLKLVRISALAAAALAVMFAAPRPSSAQDGTLRVAITSKSLIYAPLYLAERKGLFKQAGVKVEIVDAGGGTKVAAGLAGGSINAAFMAIDHVFAATTRDQRWIMFGQLMNKEPYSFAIRKDLAAEKGITESSSYEQRVKALDGLKIAVSTLGSGTQLALASTMSKAGLSPDKAKWIPIGDPLAIVTALQHRQVDVGGRAPGPAEMAVRRGYGVMIVDYSKDQTGTLYPAIVLATTAAQLKERSADLRKMMLALREALTFTRDQPEATAKLIRDDFKAMDDASFNDGMAFDLRSLPADVLITKGEFEAAVDHHNSPYLLGTRKGAKVSSNFEESVDTVVAAK